MQNPINYNEKLLCQAILADTIQEWQTLVQTNAKKSQFDQIRAFIKGKGACVCNVLGYTPEYVIYKLEKIGGKK